MKNTDEKSYKAKMNAKIDKVLKELDDHIKKCQALALDYAGKGEILSEVTSTSLGMAYADAKFMVEKLKKIA